MNNKPKWTDEAAGNFTFKTSSDGRRILSFNGSYRYYCGGGPPGYVKDSSVPIGANGSFSVRGHYQEHDNGKVTGTNYLSLWGRFAPSGRTATVNYLSDFVYSGKSVQNPYSTKIKNSSSACQSWVRGTAIITG
jgi:hypothetical protein